MATGFPHIELSALAPTVSTADIEKCIGLAIDTKPLSVCVPPFWVKKLLVT